MRLIRIALLLAGGLSIAAPARADTYTFADGAFDTWTGTAFLADAPGAGVSDQVWTGGGDPVPSLLVHDTTGSGDVWGFHASPNAAPPTQFGIVSLDYSVESYHYSGGAQGFTFGLEQGGRYFIDANFYRATSLAGGWQPIAVTGLAANDFTDFSTGLTHPDFSAGAAPIVLGFFAANSQSETYVAYDNFQVVDTHLPEPDSLAVIGAALAALGAGRPRRRAR